MPKPDEEEYEEDIFDEIPYKCPTMTIGIIDLYGCGSALNGSLLSGIQLFREPNETDEELAERASQAVKELILQELKDNEIERLEFEKQQAEN